MSINIILNKLVYPHIKKMNFNGIQMEVIGKEKKEYYTIGDYDQYIIDVYNPKNLPYTKSSLSEFIESKIDEYAKLASYKGKIRGAGVNIWRFSENVKDVYIPANLKQQIINCISSKKVTKFYTLDRGITNHEIPIRFDLEFTSDVHFSIQYESVLVEVNVILSNILMFHDIKKEYVHFVYDNEFIGDLYDSLSQDRYDNNEFFESVIWECFEPLLESGFQFYDPSWMGFHISIESMKIDNIRF